jgi:hypothetical protein
MELKNKNEILKSTGDTVNKDVEEKCLKWNIMKKNILDQVFQIK